MNNTNPLEKQLESWVPRRPSAELKQRIFAGAQTASHPTPRTNGSGGLKTHVFSYLKEHVFGTEGTPLPFWVKFAPVCCILLVVMVLSTGRQQKSAYFAAATGSNALASLSSNLLALCATDMREQTQNVWNAVTFDWTKDGHSLSTIGSFPAGNTNIHKL